MNLKPGVTVPHEGHAVPKMHLYECGRAKYSESSINVYAHRRLEIVLQVFEQFSQEKLHSLRHLPAVALPICMPNNWDFSCFFNQNYLPFP